MFRCWFAGTSYGLGKVWVRVVRGGAATAQTTAATAHTTWQVNWMAVYSHFALIPKPTKESDKKKWTKGNLGKTDREDWRRWLLHFFVYVCHWLTSTSNAFDSELSWRGTQVPTSDMHNCPSHNATTDASGARWSVFFFLLTAPSVHSPYYDSVRLAANYPAENSEIFLKKKKKHQKSYFPRCWNGMLLESSPRWRGFKHKIHHNLWP